MLLSADFIAMACCVFVIKNILVEFKSTAGQKIALYVLVSVSLLKLLTHVVCMVGKFVSSAV